MKNNQITFNPISKCKPGITSKIIYESYKELIISDPNHWSGEKQKWEDEDKAVFENLDTRGKCYFITCLNDIPIGLGSFDPRQGPEYGIISQNCILPEYRGKGYGKKQIQEIIRRFKQMKFKNAKVTTSEHPFFISAQKMYKGLGFRETRKFIGGPDPRYKIIEFEKKL